jgi:hypothetical protein
MLNQDDLGSSVKIAGTNWSYYQRVYMRHGT